MIHQTTPLLDFYDLFQISRDAPTNDIKAAYHRALLRLHPDKQSRFSNQSPGISKAGDTATEAIRNRPPPLVPVDVASLKEAYRTLSDAGLRIEYDRSLRLKDGNHALSCGPRPAQVISLDEFTAAENMADVGFKSGSGMEADSTQEWRHECRCGGMYLIAQGDLESGTHLVGCGSCSEVIWVGYEEVETTEEER